MSKLKFFDFFSGIGGFRIGLERAGFECVGYCDNDEYANLLYKNYFDTSKELFFNDITKIKTEELPDFDILCGGFPCQSFSIAGKRRGFEDTRGTMFFEVLRILKDKRHSYFILENVKGLLNHNGGETFKTILKSLSDIGYRVQLLNSKFSGVPQSRERVYIVGCIRGKRFPKIFPLTGCGKQNNYKNELMQIDETKGNQQGSRIFTTDRISPCLTASHGNLGLFINKPRFDKYKASDTVETLKVSGETPHVYVRNGTKKRIGGRVRSEAETRLMPPQPSKNMTILL